MPQAPHNMSSAPPPPRATMGGMAGQQPPAPQARVSMPPPLPPGRQAPSQVAQPQYAQAPVQQGRVTLYAIFNGQKIPVTKDEFIIGRGSKSADLAIKDGNISRRHAAVVFHNGAYYMKDLGSTNGIEYQGRRFDTKRIDEGDAFRVCDYEIRFTYS
jgi:pSer/pThr/pTyr-binding forkhead associated (FHA) protein